MFVIAKYETFLKKCQYNLSVALKKSDELKRVMFDQAGNTRRGIAGEVAERQVEIEALQGREKLLIAELEHAKADLPRRDEQRKLAEELETKAKAVDKKALALQEQLRKTEAEATDLRVKAEEALHQSSATSRELEREREANQKTMEMSHAD